MKYYYSKRHKGIFKYYQHKRTYYGYRFTYYDQNHKRHEKSKRGFDTLNEAIAAKSNLRGSKNKNITIKDWCLHCINMIKPPIRKVTTYESYKTLLTKNVIPLVGNYTLKNIQLDIYQNNCLNYLLKHGLSRTTVVEVNARVQAIMNYAVKARYLKLNQLRFAKVPNVNVKPKREIMSKNQLAKFNHNLKHHSIFIQVIYYTLETTGMRAGELLGLKFSSIDLTNRIISITHTRDSYGIRKPKTPSSTRKIKITSKLANLLQKYAIYCKKHFKVNSHTLFILGEHGKPLIPKILSIKLKQLLIECGLNQLVHRFVVHCFRHQFASSLINKGISPIIVAQILGHANPDITLKLYSNAVPNSIPDIDKYLK